MFFDYPIVLPADRKSFGCKRNFILFGLSVLRKDDCKGICSRCGANLNIQTCDCDTTGLDPRMAAIKDIFSKFKEV